MSLVTSYFELLKQLCHMKFIHLTKSGTAIAINRDAIAYASKSSNGTRIYMRETDNEGKMIHFLVAESYDDVIVMLNAE